MFSELAFVQQLLLVVVAILNVISFVLFYVDKQRSIRNSRNRISEQRLLSSAFLLGGLGSLLGMGLARHKTRHLKFKILVPIAAVITLGVIILLVGDIDTVTNFFNLY